MSRNERETTDELFECTECRESFADDAMATVTSATEGVCVGCAERFVSLSQTKAA